MTGESEHPFATRNGWRFGAALLVEWVIVVATFVIVSRLRHPAAWIAALFVIGTRQQAIGILGHEGVHRLACRSAWLNDAVAQACCFWPVMSDLHGYRAFHLAHHRFLNTPLDPELGYRRGGAPHWDVPATPATIVRRFLLDLLGLGFFESGRMMGIARPPTRAAYLRLVLAWSVCLSVAWTFGVLWAVALWTLALMTSLVAVFRLRCWIEHLGSQGTHRVHLPPWLRWFVAPHGTWMHWEHHKWPGVPSYNLRRLREQDQSMPVVTFWELMRSYSRCAPVRSGTATLEPGAHRGATPCR